MRAACGIISIKCTTVFEDNMQPTNTPAIKMTPEEEDRMIDDAFRDVLNGYLASNHEYPRR